ncbi:MAG: isochorismatase family protein [Pseudomonadota bacterium]
MQTDMPLKTLNTALLVIDAQIGLARGAFREAETITAINRVIAFCRRCQAPIFFVQHCHQSYAPLIKGNAGWALHPELDEHPDDVRIEKRASDAFFETTLGSVLAAKDISHLYITGLQTEFCVDTTCRAALSKGLSVTLVADGHTTLGTAMPEAEVIAHHNAVLQNLAHPRLRIEVRASMDFANA